MTILANDELALLTGGPKQGAAQLRWIERQMGIKAPRKVDSHPIITWEQENGRPEERKKSKINWTVAL